MQELTGSRNQYGTFAASGTDAPPDRLHCRRFPVQQRQGIDRFLDRVRRRAVIVLLFVLLDVALIAGLGTVSIAFRNELFFKVKPAIIEGATIIFLVVLIVLPDRFLLNYFGRMMPKGMVLRPAAIGTMKMVLLAMCGYILLHIGAVLFTAFHSSRRVWAFVSGPGFYLLFIPVMPVFIVKFLKRRREQQRARARNYIKTSRFL